MARNHWLLKATWMLSLILIVASCSTQTVEDTATGVDAAGDFSALEGDGAASEAAAEAGDLESEFDSLAEGSAAEAGGESLELEGEAAPTAEGSSTDPLADEFAQFEEGGESADQAAAGSDLPPAVDPGIEEELSLEEPAPVAEAPAPPAEEAPPVAEAPVPPSSDELPPTPEPEPALVVTIKGLKYKSNDNGGTIVVEADGPMEFSTRRGESPGQFIVEIPNSKLLPKAKRPLNTKDFAGVIGSIDAYQNAGSTTSRVVIQLRDGAPEPVVQAEGDSLLVVTSPPNAVADASPGSAEAPLEDDSLVANPPKDSIMSSDTLEKFLSNNQTYYGKRIYLEFDDVELRDVFKMISDEANVNLILAEDVKGKISVKLRNVPWDQALVLIMKTKKLGYTRSGNVIRISSMKEILDEEKEALDVLNARKLNEVVKVRTIPVNYAKVEDLVTQIKPMLSKNGNVTSDSRTSSLIITDVEDSLERATKVVKSLDVPPQQVLIEGKIVEAKEDVEKYFGINWGLRASPTSLGRLGNSRDIIMNNSFDVRPGGTSPSSFNFDFNLGTFDVLGDLTATLGLFESEGKAKILSSPRIVAMQNDKASIEQTLQVPVRVSNLGAGGGVQQSVDFKDVKLQLEVTPQITNDGRVLMAVKILREFFGPVLDPTTGAREKNTRQAQTRVLVQNGQTAVIGGIYQNDIDQAQQRVPGIAKVPLIGWLFKNQSTTDKKNELLIFLTPRILGVLDSQAIPGQNNIQEPLPEFEL